MVSTSGMNQGVDDQFMNDRQRFNEFTDISNLVSVFIGWSFPFDLKLSQ